MVTKKNVYLILERWGDELAIATYSTKRKAQARFDDIAKRLEQNKGNNTKIFTSQDYLQVEQDKKITYQLDLITKNLL